MAHLWVRHEGVWGAQRLGSAGIDVAGLLASRAAAAADGAAYPHSDRLIRVDAAEAKSWAIIASPTSGLRVNGRTPPAGLCVLDDRDEIRGGAEKLFFSTETLAAVEPFPGSDRPVFCGRCRQSIEVGSPAVCCPGCGISYNESAELPCWTYSEKCTFCGQATALDAGFSWTPEEL